MYKYIRSYFKDFFSPVLEINGFYTAVGLGNIVMRLYTLKLSLRTQK